MKVLDDDGYRLDYEEKRDEDCISRSSAVLLFLSEKMMQDEKIRDLVSFASNQAKTIISIFLEETKLTPGMSMMLGQTQGVLKYQMDEKQFEEKLFESPILRDLQISEQQKTASKKAGLFPIVAGALLIAAAVLFVIFNPFSSKDSLLSRLGITGNLKNISSIYVYGEEVRDDYEVAQFILTDDGLNDLVLLEYDTYDTGNIEDISDFAKMENLEELCLCANNITTIEPILGLQKLRLLDVSHNYGIDLSGIAALKNLEILNIAETDHEDLSIFYELENLKTIYVTAGDYERFQNMPPHSFEVIAINTPVRTFEQLKAALNDPKVHNIQIMSSIQIPEEETITVREKVLLRGVSMEEDIVFDNYGTIELYGGFEMGLARRNNYGTIIVKNGGAYTGGMCDTYNYGDFIIEEGGYQIMERGHEFQIDSGTYENRGMLIFGGGGDFRFNGGELINNGTILWNLGDYGPGIHLNSGNYVNNGKIYLRDVRGQGLNGGNNKEIDESCIEIPISEVNSYNAQ